MKKNSGIDLSPGVCKIGAIRQAVVKKNREFLRLKRMDWFVCVGPPPNCPAREAPQA